MDPHYRQQQIGSFHLILSVIILLLTIYPYLINRNGVNLTVSAYSADEVNLKHISIKKFDIMEANDIMKPRQFIKRKAEFADSAPELERDAINFHNRIEDTDRKIKFSSLGRQFNITLHKPQYLVTKDFSVSTLDGYGNRRVVPLVKSTGDVYDAVLDGDSSSSGTVSFDMKNDLIIAQIKTGQDIFLIEPAYLHRGSLVYDVDNTTETIPKNSRIHNKIMIVYNLNDHSQSDTMMSVGGIKPQSDGPDISREPCHDINLPQANMNQSIENNTYSVRKSKRSIEYLTETASSKTRCTLHVVADYLFYKHIGNGDYQTTINYILALINRVNQIYLPIVWETGDDVPEKITNIGFTVKNITIHQEYTIISSDEIHYNMQSSKIWGAREFLDNFSRYSPPQHYCLAHLLTHRQFDSPVLGLAFVASPRFGTIGGICSPTQPRGDALFKFNTGISTSKGINGESLITRQADLVMAHELGHNLGAEHDSNDCRPSSFSGGAYLMNPFAVLGFERNNRELSKCSVIAIGRVIKKKASTCFIGVLDHVCGNGIVEENEECDGGDIGYAQNDPCCDNTCRFTPGSQCSDRHSWCCSKCRIAPAGSYCRPAEEYNCKQAGYCDGRRAICPESPPVDDNQTCVGRGQCRSGECKPFCEARFLHSCLCNNPADACKLCCKSSPEGTCVPYNIKGSFLPDGVICYRGICEKGRCEQPIQDVVERLWDVIEDITLPSLVKFLRNNIILVIILVSIPLWCIIALYIDEFDRKIKSDVVNAMAKSGQKRRQPSRSAFLPRLFVGDDASYSNNAADYHSSPSKNDRTMAQGEATQPTVLGYGNKSRGSIPIGFKPPDIGFQFQQKQDDPHEPRTSIALNNIEAQRKPGGAGEDDYPFEEVPI